MTHESDKVKEVFLQAVEIASLDARAAFLHGACGTDDGLRRRVEALLLAHERPESLLDKGAVGPAPTGDQPITESPGTQIGPYQLIEEIGSGGMGVVYMAQQQQPVCRKVALKIIKPGMDTREVIARFQAEEQALAMMDHPNIAKVHDAGNTESGRPYFALELVHGVPITVYCDDDKLSTRKRLELFVSVCNAVQHAHQKGVIHRDIKPSNILVTLHDGVPVAKIIDFGIAKAIDQGLLANTAVTGLGQMVGTPLYMSPEQAERSGLDVDTRSDIYSLGVLLYELLTGTTPFSKEQLREAGAEGMKQLIREQEPDRPSTRISTLGKAATTLSERRSTAPAELAKTLRQELDWIVMKALEKDRTRRYETAADFARDIQRYLHDEPVTACPPTRLYRLRKFVRRNRVAALTTSAVALTLVVGAAVAGGQAYRATKAERRAKAQQQLAEAAAKRERDLRNEADAARNEAERLAAFLVEIFRSPDPERDGRTITVAEMLDKAKSSLETEMKDDAQLRARLFYSLGETYSALGLLKEAAQLYEIVYHQCRKLRGPRHEYTVNLMNSLSGIYSKLGQFGKALPLAEESLKITKEDLGPKHPRTATAMTLLAIVLYRAGQLERALPLHEKALALRQEVLGPNHEETLSCMSDLANLYGHLERWDHAVGINEKLLSYHRAKSGNEHPDTLVLIGNLACCHAEGGRNKQSIAMLEETLPLMQKVFGDEHPKTLGHMQNLATIYADDNQPQKAARLFEQIIPLIKDKLGGDHPNVLLAMYNLSKSYWALQRFDEALALREKTVTLSSETLGPEHRWTLRFMHGLAEFYGKQQQPDRSIPLLEQVVTGRRKTLGKDHPDTLDSVILLGGLYLQRGDFLDAEPLFREAYRASVERRESGSTPRDDEQARTVLSHLVDLHEKLKQPDKVAQWKAELEVLPKPPQADSTDGSPQSVDRLSDDTESEK